MTPAERRARRLQPVTLTSRGTPGNFKALARRYPGEVAWLLRGDEIATAHGLTLYRRAGGERGWHDMREGALLAFARAVERLALERAAALCDTAAEASGNHPRAGAALACAGAIRNLMTETRNG